ncbi:MAG: TIGR02611 family protein [Candidatus Saccharimonadales bacterium]
MKIRIQQQIKRAVVGVGGGVLLIAGLIMIPYPGPGWLVTFAALALLSTEFVWADALLLRLRRYYGRWTEWLKRQHVVVRLLVLLLTGLIVIATIYLLNGYGLIDEWLDLDLNWVYSPLLK